jgi:hypothetical protein
VAGDYDPSDLDLSVRSRSGVMDSPAPALFIQSSKTVGAVSLRRSPINLCIMVDQTHSQKG